MYQYFPICNHLKNYNWQYFATDCKAGITTAILLAPQGMAYAILAGLPVQLGLYASITPALAYAVFASSRTVSVGPVSIVAIMIAEVLAMHSTASADVVSIALILACEGGLVLLAMALLRMGGLVHFISHPVLTGFVSGTAILIATSQIPHLLGFASSCSDFACYAKLPAVNIYTIAIGGGSLLLLLFFALPLPHILQKWGINQQLRQTITRSAPLLVVVLGSIAAANFQLGEKIALVGAVPAGLPLPSLAFLSNLSRWQQLLPSAAFIAVLSYVESVAIAKAVASNKINPNQELLALAAANITSAFSGGMSVAGGFSRTVVNAAAKTQISMVVASLLIAIVLLFFTQALATIPKSSLAAIILLAIFPLLKRGWLSIASTWRYDLADGIAEIACLFGVLILGIEQGISIGVAVTVLTFLRRSSRPHIALVGQIEGNQHFRNIQRHKVQTFNNLLLIRIDENIIFANASYIIDFIEKQVSAQQDLQSLILIFSSVSHIDSSGLKALESLIHTLHSQSITLNLAEVKGPVMDKLQHSRLLALLPPGQVFQQTTQAVQSCTR